MTATTIATSQACVKAAGNVQTLQHSDAGVQLAVNPSLGISASSYTIAKILWFGPEVIRKLLCNDPPFNHFQSCQCFLTRYWRFWLLAWLKFLCLNAAKFEVDLWMQKMHLQLFHSYLTITVHHMICEYYAARKMICSQGLNVFSVISTCIIETKSINHPWCRGSNCMV